MIPEAFDELLNEFERECMKLERMDSSHGFDPTRPYQLQEVNLLRSRVRLAFRDALTGRWPQPETKRYRSALRCIAEADQGELSLREVMRIADDALDPETGHEHAWRPIESPDWTHLEMCKACKATRSAKTFLIQTIDTRSDIALWWRPNGAGYTSNLDEAGRFDERRARGQEKVREEDKAWPEDQVLPVAHRVVRTDRLAAVSEQEPEK